MIFNHRAQPRLSSDTEIRNAILALDAAGEYASFERANEKFGIRGQNFRFRQMRDQMAEDGLLRHQNFRRERSR